MKAGNKLLVKSDRLLEQNLVIRSSLPAPDSLGAGLNNQSTVLQVWTEFSNPPEPRVSAITNNGVEDDLVLDFGAMKMIQGQTFATPQTQGPSPLENGLHSQKKWAHINGRTFLIESVEYQSLSNKLQTLPPHASIPAPGSNSIPATAALFPLQPRLRADRPVSTPMQLVQASPAQPGLVLDWTMVTSSTDYDFRGDTTYLVDGQVYVNGTQNRFEPGTVVKFTNLWNANIYLYDTAGAFVFAGSAYAPSIFTMMDDDSVGEPIPTSSGPPSIGSSPFLRSAAANLVISHARFSYGDDGMFYDASGAITVRHSQFFNCNTGLFLYTAANNTVNLQNVLASECSLVINANSASADIVNAENITVDQCTTFVVNYGSTFSGGITNWVQDKKVTKNEIRRD